MKNTAQSRFFIIKYQGQSHQSTHNAKINIIDHASTHNNKENIQLDNYYCCVVTIITTHTQYRSLSKQHEIYECNKRPWWTTLNTR